MKRVFALLTTIMAILTLLVPLSLAQKPSPAGGRFLELNGKDNSLILETGELVNTKFEDVTVEAWIYLRSLPHKRQWIVAAKWGTFQLLVGGWNDPKENPPFVPCNFMVSFRVYTGDVERMSWTIGGIGIYVCENQLQNWYHISGSFDSSSHLHRVSFNGKLSTIQSPFQNLLMGIPLFYIGGTKWWADSYFDGFIDEVRISNVVRYKSSFRPPSKPFEADENTLALWHFDEDEGEFRFADSSGNGNTLIAKGSGFGVEPKGKLSSTWANIKNFGGRCPLPKGFR